MDLDGFLKRTSRNGLPARGRAIGRAVNNSLHDVRARLKISSQSLHDKDAAAQLNRRAYTSPYAFFCEESTCIYRCCCTMHVQVCILDRCCEHQRTHLLHALYRMCICDRCRDIYIYICEKAYVYVYMYMYMYVRMCMYMYPCMYVYVYVCICIHIYVYACMRVYVYMHMCTCVCI